MVTEIGKFLRVLRAKNLETAKEMAKNVIEIIKKEEDDDDEEISEE